MWSFPVQDQECFSGSATEQLLADISSSAVTESNSEGVSTQLVSLSPESPLLLQELDTVTDLAAALVEAGAANVLVSSSLNATSIKLRTTIEFSGLLFSDRCMQLSFLVTQA